MVVEKEDVLTLLSKFHEGVCGGHFARRITAEKILQGEYHCPKLFKDAMEYCKTCDVCQTFANKSMVHVPLHPIPPLGAFEKWGIDLMGPLPITTRANKFLVAATNYLTKWAEVMPLKTSKK